MKGGLSLPALLAQALAVAGPAQAADAERPVPSETSAILRGVRACANGVVPGDFYPKKFAADGWLAAGRKEVDMGAGPVQRLMYVRSEGGVLVSVLITKAGSVSCSTMARVASASQVSEIKDAIAAEFKTQSFADFQGDEAFKAYVLKTIPGGEANILFSRERRFSIDFSADSSDPKINVLVVPRRESR